MPEGSGVGWTMPRQLWNFAVTIRRLMVRR